MTKEELEKILFSKRTHVFAVLDGAAIPELRMQIYKMSPRHYCLYRGELEPDLAEVMPYVVGLLPQTHFTDWLLNESFGKNWGIFAHSPHSIKEMRRHFRSMFTAYDDKGDPMLFRFYDPRVIRPFLPTCTADELKTFFGRVERFFAEDETGENLLAYEIENEELKETQVN